MKSFPSTLNESQNMYGSTRSQSYEATFDIERIKHGALNLNKSVPVVQEMLKPSNINISNYMKYPNTHTISNPSTMISGTDRDASLITVDGKYTEWSLDKNGNINSSIKSGKTNALNQTSKTRDEAVFYENPLQLPANVIALAKDYDWVYKNKVKSIVNAEKEGDSMKVKLAETSVAPSMFNPMYGVCVLGITRNTPLLNDTEDAELDPQITDCSIRTLCALSKTANSSLGQARYKYADFMYCKDLGKVSNNHLITLRKFAHPIGDHIFEMTSPKYVSTAGDHSFQVEGDIGRLVTWFGTDDNKLEDICKYSYHATWKELEAQIEQQDSQADDSTSGILGMISNGFNPAYNQAVDAGQAGTHSIWGWLGSQLSDHTMQGIGKNNGLLRNYDNNKVYTPQNTIQSTNIYEGKLEFSHEFTLNFSYQLRAYDNINPRSALMDLIGNILEVTYRRGKFWGGSRKLIGPPQDMGPFNKTSAFIDNAFDKLGGFFSSLIDGGINFQDILGKIGSTFNNMIGQAMNLMKGNGLSEVGSALAQKIKDLNDTAAFTEAAKGYLKNALGRPTLYAWQSLLSGDDVGLWHVTIGNPRNPILAMGNLILTNATVTHSGPLGIDDFPSELKVSVTLKHARPRDLTEISRMYTRGASTIYHHFAHHNVNNFFGGGSGSTQANGQDNQKTIDEGYKQDVTTYSGNDYKFQFRPELTETHISNPFLTSDEHIKVMRTNNWSDTMFSVSMQEAA